MSKKTRTIENDQKPSVFLLNPGFIIPVLFGIIVPIIFVFVPALNNLFASIGIETGLLAIVIGFLVSLYYEYKKQNKELEQRDCYLQEIKNVILPMNVLRAYDNDLSAANSIFKNTFPEYLESIQIDKNEFTVKGSYWAYKANKRVWEFLVDKQKYYGLKGKTIEVMAVDFSYIRFENDKSYQIQNTIKKQREFLDNGGRIRRIFYFDKSIELENEIKTIKKIFEKYQGSQNYEFVYSTGALLPRDYMYAKQDNETICSSEWVYIDGYSKIPNRIIVRDDIDSTFEDQWQDEYQKYKKNRFEV
jgi:hypothetical protein